MIVRDEEFTMIEHIPCPKGYEQWPEIDNLDAGEADDDQTEIEGS